MWSSFMSRPGDGSGPVDGGENRRLRCLLNRVGGDLTDDEADVDAAAGVVDHHRVAGVEITEVREERGPAEDVVDVPGDRRGAVVTGDAAAAVPERVLPDRVAGWPLGRVHGAVRGDPDAEHGRAHLERGQPELERQADRPGVEVRARGHERPRDGRGRRRLGGGDARSRSPAVGGAAAPHERPRGHGGQGQASAEGGAGARACGNRCRQSGSFRVR